MSRKALISVAALAALALGGTAACAGDAKSAPKAPVITSGGEAYGKDKPAVTLNVWHGWTNDREVNAFQKVVDKFHAAHPNITVNLTKGVQDQQIINGIRGGEKVDVAVSFTTDNVGYFCDSGAWVDLGSYLKASGVDPAKTFSSAALSYTQYKGKQCALPLLGDAYGLYYNKEMFDAAGITAPPKTMSELKADALKLTQKNADGSIKVAGYLPQFELYENAPIHLGGAYGLKWQDAGNKSILASDPGITQMLKDQKDLTDALGGFDALEKFRTGPAAGDEGSANNAFIQGKIAMVLGGEWTTAEIAQDKPDMKYATAPFPVADSRADKYGAGYISGTVIGIAKTTAHADAAWEFTKYITTDTDALNSFATDIKNVPTTFDSLKASTLAQDPNFKTFLDVAANPNSTTSPSTTNGGAYQLSFGTWIQDFEAGKAPDVAKALADLDTQIDAATAQNKAPGSS
jgi:multiple sugar transport system substrate-binding protein